MSKPYFRSLQDIKPHKKVYLPIINDPFYFVMVRSGFCHLSIPLPPYVQESNHFGGEGVTRHYHTRAPSIWTVTVLYLDMFDHPRFRRFFLAELLCLWKGKMKKNDAVLTSMKCKMDQEKTGAPFPSNSGNWYLGQKKKRKMLAGSVKLPVLWCLYVLISYVQSWINLFL